MKLYYSLGACSLAPNIVLHELKIPHELVAVKLKDKTYAGGNYYEVNPKGTVPALELDNGQILTEIPAILQYLADMKPEARLVPRPGSLERVRCQEWLNYIATEFHKTFSPLFRDDTPEPYKESMREKLKGRFDFFGATLSKQDWLLGSEYSIADAYLTTILRWPRALKISMENWPVMMGYLEKSLARPATREAIKAESPLK